MKQFFKMFFASILGVFVAMFILFFATIVIISGMMTSLESSSQVHSSPASDEHIFKLTLDGAISDTDQDSPFASLLGNSKSASIKSIISAIRKAKKSESIKGIYLDMGGFSAGSAGVDAIRRELADFKKAGKFIVAYADQYGQSAYYLASVADSVYLNPKGMLMLQGLSSQTMFYKGLFEKAGVEMMVFRVGTYKGAVEPFLNDKLSDANREQITAYQQTVWTNIIENIAASRNISTADINHFADAGLFFGDPAAALECHLIDGLKYRNEVEDALKIRVGQDVEKEMKTVGLAKMNSVKGDEENHKDKIAILYAEGEIQSEEAATYGASSSVITERLSNELRKLAQDDEVKAVVLRINSPGGSAYVSEQIWKAVLDLKRKKPVVASMGNMAASGGYYIACGANSIVAEANTLTGSIGIFAIFPNLAGLHKKLNLTTDVVKTNRYADLGDQGRPMTDDEKALIQGYIDHGYRTFISRCAAGRAKTTIAIDSIAQGRVWTGEQALSIGLVDELGGVDKAVEVAAKLAAVTEYSVKDVSTSKDFFKELLQKQFEGARIAIVKEVLGDEYDYFMMLRRVKNAAGIQARLPYDLKPL